MAHIERTRRTRRRVRAGARPGPAADHSGRPGCEGLVDLLRADVVHVGVDGACCDDELLAGDDFGRGTDDEVGVHASHDIRVAGLANPGNAPIFNPDVSL